MIRWYWKVYKINGSFRKSLEKIGCSFKNEDTIYSDYQFIYAWFDGTREGRWFTSNVIRGDFHYYEYKGVISIKEIRKQKIEKIQNESCL